MPRNNPSASARLAFLCLTVLGLLAPPTAGAAERPEREAEPGVRLDRLALAGGSGALCRFLGYKYLDRAWYQGQKQDHIRWIHDWSGETYVNVDKAGHFMGGLVMAEVMNETYSWCGFGTRSAAVLGTLTSWAALLEIEMRDAYFDQWGFSIPDFFTNTVGASVPLVHALFPATRAVRFKFSYLPSPLYLDYEERVQPPERPHTEHLIDDYEGMTFWMAVSVNQFLRGRAEELWPDYLGLALGYGAQGMHGSNVKSRGPNKYFRDLPDATPEILVALDYDARFLPGAGGIWDQLKGQLNWIHFPAPAVRLYPSWRFYFLYM